VSSHYPWEPERRVLNPITASYSVLDLYNFQTREFYEIKPTSQLSEGQGQVRQRVLELGVVPAKGLFVESWLPSGLPWLTIHAWEAGPGLIVYKWLWNPPLPFPFPFPARSRAPSPVPRDRWLPAPRPVPGLAVALRESSASASGTLVVLGGRK
jgi:hypothetical protein